MGVAPLALARLRTHAVYDPMETVARTKLRMEYSCAATFIVCLMPAKDEKLGQPIIQNGIPLSKIHHAAFDAHLIGIDADYRLHVSDRLLGLNDGPILEALKQLNGQPIHLPARKIDYPDRDRLAVRFEKYKAVI